MITCKIKKITKGKKKTEVFDIIGIPDNHNFVANGVVVHNCDESVRFASACITGDTLIKTPHGDITIKKLVDNENFKVYSFNEKTKKEEIKTAKKCLKIKKDVVYEITTKDGTKIQATKEHKFLTNNGWKRLEELTNGDKFFLKNKEIISIKKIGIKEVYDIIGVDDNNNYIANNIVVHNSDWAKTENKDLKKKLAQVRTKHLLYILCFPLKVYKLENSYLQSFTNYWIHLVGRGKGAVFVKDMNPVQDAWRLKMFEKLASFNEFTPMSKIEHILKKHPNFWMSVRFPKPPEWLYTKYLGVRESNVYDEDAVMQNVTKQDMHRALLIMALRDIMLHDTALSMNRIILHIKNEYDINLSKKIITDCVDDAKQLVVKIKEQALQI